MIVSSSRLDLAELLYRVLVVDCPWQYNDRKGTRRDNKAKIPKSGYGAQGNYSQGVMSLAELEALGPELDRLTAPDAYLFMWATCPRLQEAMTLMRSWGFRYVTVAFQWTKTTLSDGFRKGPGRYVPANMELVLLGVKGKGRPWHPSTGSKPAQEVRLPHPRNPLTGKIRHSRKPEEIQDRIERWLGDHIGDQGYLELFATRNRPGWTCLGWDVTGRKIDEDLRLLDPTRVAA